MGGKTGDDLFFIIFLVLKKFFQKKKKQRRPRGMENRYFNEVIRSRNGGDEGSQGGVKPFFKRGGE